MDIKNIIIQKIDLPEFIRERAGVELHRSGNGWRCKCPIHDGSENPSAMFIDDHGGYYCYACNSGGNVINFLADYEHITYSAATEQLASMLNINLQTDAEYQSQKEIERKYEQEKEQGIRGLENVYQYLTEKRGFTDSTIQAFALGSHNGCLTIPLIDVNGRTVGMARRQFDKQPKYINSKNNALLDKSEYFFGFDKARRLVREKMYVVEGYMDAMSGYQMGLPTVACCSNGLSKDQVRVLSQFLRRETAIILCPDNDEAGHKRIPRIREYFNSIDPGRQVRIVVVPDEFKDMNDMLLAGVNPADLPTEHIDKYVMDLLLYGCSTPEEEYACAEGYLPTVRSEMIRLDIIKMLAERWEKDVEDLKRYFNTVGEDSNDLIREASDVNSCIADLRKIYSVGGYKTHFQQIDNCIRKVEKKQVVVVGAYSGVGKALTLDSLLITPNGTIRMGDVKVGDTVIDENGNPTKVTHVFPQGEKDVYRVTFKDKTYVDCCEDHLWKFKTRDDFRRGYGWKVKPLKEIISGYKLRRGSRGQQGHNLYIPVSKPLNIPERFHIIPPYVMGLLLGDGGFSTAQISFTNTEQDVITKLKDETSQFGEWRKHRNNDIQYTLAGGRNNIMVNYIRDTFNSCTGESKFIPKEYLYDSKENRLALLQGLIDTDGYVNEKGVTMFFTSSKVLADDVAWLIRSLGSRCFVRKYKRDMRHSPEYIISIQEKSDKWFTSMKRKAQWDARKQFGRKIFTDRLAIDSIEKLGIQKPMQCITVDSPSHTYLCNDFVVTHNTDFVIEYVLRQICQEKMRVIFFSLEMPKGKLIERVIAKLVGCSISEVEGYIASDDTTVQQAISKIQDYLLVYDGNNYTIQDIEKRIQTVNSKNVLGGPVDMVVVDYFGYMKGTSDFEGASSSATKMKAIAKENNIIFVMLSQLNRGGNPYGEPNMQQLKLTGDLEASADVIMLLWRPEKDPNLSIAEKQELENVTRLKIDKARDGMFGSNLAEFAYNRETSRLEEHYM